MDPALVNANCAQWCCNLTSQKAGVPATNCWSLPPIGLAQCVQKCPPKASAWTAPTFPDWTTVQVQGVTIRFPDPTKERVVPTVSSTSRTVLAPQATKPSASLISIITGAPAPAAGRTGPAAGPVTLVTPTTGGGGAPTGPVTILTPGGGSMPDPTLPPAPPTVIPVVPTGTFFERNKTLVIGLGAVGVFVAIAAAVAMRRKH